MNEMIEAINAALAAGINPVTAIRAAFNYTLDELAVTSGLAISELVHLEAGNIDAEKLTRLASALGLPDGTVNCG